ncbi:hypothetical protein [Flavobacterium microcysteis]|uniref:Glycosyltransferase family 39 protein n=1 Tax=Flavobacterium microcysteis TaxID=2596891 RepID=A0A501QLB6_9FLAO|nr:hypothetical protein [Flavobacterium microcysteis]TPD73569.1 hypothetical protein FJA49_00625 [Flavobacterium microcysteis]
MKTIQANTIYRSLFFMIIAIYCLFTARYGFETWDTGYIPSFSWRIANGQDVYNDFVYKAPPSTLYFQAIFMKILPEIGQFYFIKVTNYVLFALQVFLAVKSFTNFYPQQIKFNKWALMILGLVISLLNFTAYPWPTTDGLLFAVIALYIFSLNTKSNGWQLIAIAFFCLMSSLTKQSFYLIPIGFLFVIIGMQGIKKGLFFFFYLVLFFLLFLSWVAYTSSLHEFLEQTTGQTHFKDLLFSGFLDYIITYPKVVVFIPLLIISAFLLFYFPKRKTLGILEYLKNLAVVLLVFALSLCFFREFLFASRIAMLSASFAVVSKVIKDRKNFSYYMPILLSLLIAWSCSISMGYNYPIFFSTGIILSITVLFAEELNKIYNQKAFILVGSIILVLAYSLNLRPYREKPFSELEYPLADVSPKLKYLITHKDNKDKLLDLKSLIKKYGNNYIVAPSFPMAHYTFNTQSILPADWLTNNEVNRDPERILKIAAKKENYVFLEKSFLEGEEFMFDNRADFSVIAIYIYKNFKKIDETKHFIIFNTLEKNEAFPVIIKKSVH